MMPTPLDLARRASVRRPAPATRAPVEPFRAAYERAIRHSGLPSNQRLVALVLATYADQATGAPSRDQPGVGRLADDTGLTERAAKEALYVLRQLGWIKRPRPQRSGHGSDPIPITLQIPLYARARLGLPPEDGIPTS